MHNDQNSQPATGQDRIDGSTTARPSRRPRATTDGHWFWCSQAAADYALEVGGHVGLALYLGLCRRHAKAGGRDEFHASATNLAAVTGLGVRTVEKWLPVLVKAKLVMLRSGRHSGPGGAHCANTYFLPAPPSAPRADASAPDSGFRCGQIEGSLQSKEEPSAATRAGGADAPRPHAATDDEPERPWY